jgi:hypothetical protein
MTRHGRAVCTCCTRPWHPTHWPNRSDDLILSHNTITLIKTLIILVPAQIQYSESEAFISTKTITDGH